MNRYNKGIAQGNIGGGADMSQPKAPKDAEAKRKGFYILRNTQIAASVQPDG